MAGGKVDIIMCTIVGAMVILVAEAWFLLLLVLPRFCGSSGEYPVSYRRFKPVCNFENTMSWLFEPRIGWFVFAGVMFLFLVYVLNRGVVAFFRGST